MQVIIGIPQRINYTLFFDITNSKEGNPMLEIFEFIQNIFQYLVFYLSESSIYMSLFVLFTHEKVSLIKA